MGISKRDVAGAALLAVGLAVALAVVAAAQQAGAVTHRPVFVGVSDLPWPEGAVEEAVARVEGAREAEEAEEETAHEEPAYDFEEPVYDYPEVVYDYEPTAYDYGTGGYEPSGGLTKEGGVNYHDGRRETYYSSEVLHHKDIDQWELDAEGFYRDSEGRYVVAASDMEQGTVFQGSKGECVVLDTGCPAGVTDYYVNWG